MIFWILSFGLAALIAAAIARSMILERPADTENPDIRVYRDQLAEVDRDLARGALAVEEAERVRTEVARRLLEADSAQGPAAGSAPQTASVIALVLAGLLLIGGAGAMYVRLGAPGYPDLPMDLRIAQSEELRQSRPSQAEAEAAAAAAAAMPDLQRADPEFLKLMERLRETVAQRPDDVQGLRLLARNEAGLGNFAAAAEAQARILQLTEDPGVDTMMNYAEYLIAAAGGYVSPEAEAVIAQALRVAPGDLRARYFAGLLYAQIRRPDVAFRFWRGLLEDSPPDAPWVPPVRAEIEALARLAGVDYTLPAEAPLPGPDAADVAAAGDMTADERQGMIRGMVAGLAERLATDGGAPEEWARLIRAYGVLGETEQAAAIWAEAQQVFADAPAALDALRGAATDAGVAGQ